MENKFRILENSMLVNNEILVFSDFHLGYEEGLNKEGLFPRVGFKESMNVLKRVFELLESEEIGLKKIIVLGDLKHEFGSILDSEWSEGVRLLDYLIEKIGNKNIILIKGNHDNILKPIAMKKEIKLVDYYCINDICFLHGDKYFEEINDDCKVLVLGHLHPAISLDDSYKKEKYKCFLKGKWKKEFLLI